MTAADQAGGRLMELGGTTLHVTESGPPGGRPVVLVHGFLTDSTTWRHVAPGLAERYRTVLVDLPACGGSPVPGRTDWTADSAADLLVGLLDALELRDPVLVGSQMGGSLTAWTAARHPGRLAGMVVMAAGALGEGAANLGLFRALGAPLLGPLLARAFPYGPFAARWAATHGPGFVPEPTAVAHYHRQLRRRGAPMARFGLGVRLSYGEDFDVLAGPLRGATLPTTLLFGAADRLVPPSTGRRFAELLPHARLVELPGCGDFPQEERPDEVRDAVRALIERL